MSQDYLTYLYSFELLLVNLELPSATSKSFTIQWKKGHKVTKTQPIKSRNKLIHLNQTLKLCLKLSRNKNGQYLSKHTTLSLMQGNQSDLIEVSSGKIDLADILSNNRTDLVVSMFPEPCKLNCKLKFEFVMELKHFKFGNQQMQESDEQVKEIQINQEPISNFVNEQQKLILKKQVQDINYLNQKLRSDRDKLLLKVRQLESDFKQKQKLILRQMRQVKTFFDQKIRIRQSIYEQEIQKIVFVNNERISQNQQYLIKFEDQNDDLKNRLKTKQTQIARLRDQLLKLHAQKQELQSQNKLLQQDRNDKHQNNLNLIEKYQGKLKELLDETTKKAEQFFDQKQSQKTQMIIAQQEQRQELSSRINMLQVQCDQKNHLINDLQKRIKYLQEQTTDKNNTINKIDEMLNQRRNQLLSRQFENVQISHRLESILSQNRSIEDNLVQQMALAQSDRKQLSQTRLKLENLSVTYRLDKQNFNDEKERFKISQSVYQQEISFLKNDLKRYQIELEQYQHKQMQISSQNDRLHNQNQKNKQLFELQSKMFQKHEQQLNNFKTMFEQKQDQLRLKQDELEQKNHEIDNLEIEIRKVINDKQEAENKIIRLQIKTKNYEDLQNNKIQRQIDQIDKYNEIVKKQHENELQLQRIRSQLSNKQSYISKLQKQKGQMMARIKMKKNQVSQVDDSFMFKSFTSEKTTPKEGDRISLVEYTSIKTQMEHFKKQNDKKDNQITNLRNSLQQKSNTIDELRDQLSKAGESRIRGDIKNIQRELSEFSKKNQKVTNMLSRYEQRIQSLMHQVFDILENGGGRSKTAINKLTNDFHNLHQQIIDIKDESQKIEKSPIFRKNTFGKSTDNFSFVGDSRISQNNQDLQSQIKQKDNQIKNLKQQIFKLKRTIKVTSQDQDDQHPNFRSKSRSKIQRYDDHRQTFGTTRQNRRGQDQFEQNIENFRRTKMQKQMAMKQSQMMKSSQLLDIRIQTLSHELKLKTASEQQLSNELKQKILKNKQLQDQLMVLRGQNFNIRQQARKLQYTLDSTQRQIAQLHKNRQNQIKNNNSNQITLLNRQNSQLKERQNKLQHQLEKLKQEYKDKYIRYSEHKDIISELDRTLKDKGKQLQNARRQINDITQSKNKFELVSKSQQSQIQQLKKKLNKLIDNQSSALEDKESQIKALKRKVINFERQQQEYESKIQSLQDKTKHLSAESERVSDEFNRRNINQLKDINVLKQQQELLNEQIKLLKRRNQQLNKINNDNEQKIVSLSKTQEQNKRKIDKLNKQIQNKDEEADKMKYQLRKLGDEIKRNESTTQDYFKQKKSLQEQINNLTKNLDNQLFEFKKVTKQLQKTKNQVNETQSDHYSNSKNNKLQIQRIADDKRKIQKISEDQSNEIKSLQSKLKKLQEQHSQQLASNNKTYGQRMSVALNQIETIRKAVRQAEQQISDYEAENRELHDEVQRLNSKIITIQNQRQSLIITLDSTLGDLQIKKQQIQILKKQRFDLELKNTRSSSQVQASQQDYQKLSQKLSKVSQSNKALTQTIDQLQNQLRTFKIQYSQLMQQFNVIQPYESKYKNLQKQFKQLQTDYSDVSNELKYKLNCVYTKDDFDNYQKSIKTRYQNQMQLYLQKHAKQVSQNYEVKKQHIQNQIVQLLNENGGIRTQLQKYRQQNISLSSQVNDLSQYKQQSQRLRIQLNANESLVKQLQIQLSHFINTNKQSDSKYSYLEQQLTEFKASSSTLKQQNSHLESLNLKLTQTIQTLQSEINKLEASNEQMNNRILQQEFEITRLRENQVFEKSSYQKRIQELLHSEQGQLKNAENTYIEKIHVYNNEMDKLKNILNQLKYLVEEKTNTIDDLSNQNDALENQLVMIKEQFQQYKLRSNQQKEISSLQLFKMSTKLRQTQDQAAMKYRRMQQQINKISQQLVAVSSTGGHNTSFTNNKINNSRLSQRQQERSAKRYEQKMKLKDKTIQQLKIQNMNLQAQIFKAQEQKSFTVDNKIITQLKQQITILKAQLDKYQGMSINQSEINDLNEQILSLRKKLAKSKRTQEQLTQKLEQITLKYDSLSSQMIYYKGLQNANKQLKSKYQQICQQLRGSRLQRSVTSQTQHQLQLLQGQKQDLERQIDQMQSIILKLGGNRDESQFMTKSNLH